MARHKPGDKVMLRKDLIQGVAYDMDEGKGRDVFYEEMRLDGELTIGVVNLADLENPKVISYELEEGDGYVYTDQMFDPTYLRREDE